MKPNGNVSARQCSGVAPELKLCPAYFRNEPVGIPASPTQRAFAISLSGGSCLFCPPLRYCRLKLLSSCAITATCWNFGSVVCAFCPDFSDLEVRCVGGPRSLSLWDIRRRCPSCHSCYRSVIRPAVGGERPRNPYGWLSYGRAIHQFARLVGSTVTGLSSPRRCRRQDLNLRTRCTELFPPSFRLRVADGISEHRRPRERR